MVVGLIVCQILSGIQIKSLVGETNWSSQIYQFNNNDKKNIIIQYKIRVFLIKTSLTKNLIGKMLE